jgi:hypothetical protein
VIRSVAALLVLGLVLGFPTFKKEGRGTFLGLPYSFERPTPGQVRRSLWDPDDARLLAPHVFGWGYSVNVHAIARRLGLV